MTYRPPAPVEQTEDATIVQAPPVEPLNNFDYMRNRLKPLANGHEHDFAVPVAIKVADFTSQQMHEIDDLRRDLSRHLSRGTFKDAYKPYDFHADDRVIVALACTDHPDVRRPVEMGRPAEMRQLFARLKKKFNARQRPQENQVV
jgi:hypothetical protein